MLDISGRIVVFGITSLMSTNFIQGGITEAICSFAAFLAIVNITSLIFIKKFGQQFYNLNILIYHFIIVCWAMAIVANYVYKIIHYEPPEN